MRNEKKDGRSHKRSEYIVGVAVGLTVALICFIASTFWDRFNPFIKDDPSSSPSPSVEATQTTPLVDPVPGSTPTQAPAPSSNQPVAPTQTPIWHPSPAPPPPTTPRPTTNPTPTPILTPPPTKDPTSDPAFNGNADIGGGVTVGGDGELQVTPPPIYDYPEQDVITGTIPEPQ